MLNKHSIIFNRPLGIYLSSACLFLIGFWGVAGYFPSGENLSDAGELSALSPSGDAFSDTGELLGLSLSLIEITLAGGLLLRKNWARRGTVLLMYISIFSLFTTSIILFTFTVFLGSDFSVWGIGTTIFLLLLLYIHIKILRYLKKEEIVADFNDKER